MDDSLRLLFDHLFVPLFQGVLLLAQIDDVGVEDSDEFGLVHEFFFQFLLLLENVLKMAADRVD